MPGRPPKSRQIPSESASLAQQFPKSLSIPPLTSSRNSGLATGLRESCTLKYSAGDSKQPALVDMASGGAHAQQPFLNRSFRELAIVHPARDG